MDEVKVMSKFMKGIISRLVNNTIRKKLGYNFDIQLNELYVSITDGKAHIHLNANAEIDNGELSKILKNIGLD